MGKDRVYRAADDVKDTWVALLVGNAPEQPYSGPLKVSVRVVFPVLKSDVNTRAKREQMEMMRLAYHMGKPDADNILKALFDAMTLLRFWEDDSQVVDVRCQKFRGMTPGVNIRIDGALSFFTPDPSTNTDGKHTGGAL